MMTRTMQRRAKLPEVTTAKPTRKISVWGGQNEIKGFSKSDISAVVQFMQDQCPDPRGVPLKAFERSFRKHSVSTKFFSDEENARRFLLTMDFFLQMSNQCLFDWFNALDVNGSGRITIFKFQSGLRKLAEAVHQPTFFTPANLNTITKFVNSASLNEISLEDVEHAFSRVRKSNKEEELKEKVGTLIDFLKKVMDREKIRVIDLFNSIDVNEDGAVSPEEIQSAIKMLILSPELITRKNTTKNVNDKVGGHKLLPVHVNNPMRGSPEIKNHSVGFAQSSSDLKPVKTRKPIKNREHKLYLKLLRESQEYLESKFDAFDTNNEEYQAKVRTGVCKYLNKMDYIDRCINIDLNTLGHL